MTNLLPGREFLILILKNYTSFFSPEMTSELKKKGKPGTPDRASLKNPEENFL
jgi:hypothetical protein